MNDNDEYEYERQIKSFGWAVFEVYSGVANIILAPYFICRFKKLLKLMNDSQRKMFLQSVSFSIAAVAASIVVSISQILSKLDIFLFQEEFLPDAHACDTQSCAFCTVCQRLRSCASTFRNCCIYLIFLQTIQSHFNTRVSLKHGIYTCEAKIGRCIKICLIVSQIIVIVIIAVFMDGKLFRLSDSNHTACFRIQTSVITSVGGINSGILLIVLISIIIIFFTESRKV